jgi:hypothetical protein
VAAAPAAAHGGDIDHCWQSGGASAGDTHDDWDDTGCAHVGDHLD